MPDRCFEALLLSGDDGAPLYLGARFFVVCVRHRRRVAIRFGRRAIYKDATSLCHVALVPGSPSQSAISA